ncbi:MAG: lactoylglutathione lyase [Candidatus Lambdaproteobacteria bacterium RIFOXYD12_FULL_49_8]|uniref:Lactoylglutathione lyase n=1 Tax=Candidatus Lambdaproteobacteria bacterium RIFOXYD2_FULL_50_16 TaxID=1817772 RepID=A0A1F6GBR3_9PROT|nr:MAG: lactoylglutathione lyase [Candidatus Lambdaproteobacteria bacterium RIFOXYD2_FULL_50_16]OGG97460.1 MAG: lactoylglutathione lyase [Candidatus Lambdaproteobacteria bacterium RIFOXYD12_FULL_49_8]
MSSNAISWFEIYVEDMARAKAFYEGVFQVTLSQIPAPNTEMWAFEGNPDVYGAHGALVKMPGFEVGKNSVLVYFACEDCAVTQARVAQFGGQIKGNKRSIGEHGFISLVFDPEGNLIGLHSFK